VLGLQGASCGQVPAASSASIAPVNTRARWTIGILVALVIGLVVGLIIVAGDNDNTSNTQPIQSVTTTASPTTTSQTTTSTPTRTNGGTPVPNPGGSTTPGGTGGL
jgi:hypothetical protein